MSSAVPQADATGLGGEEVLSPQMLAATRKAPTRRGVRRVRPWYMSVLLHGGLIVATIIAIFPVFWIGISSFKPREEIISSPTLNVLPDNWTLSNYHTVITANDYEFLTWFKNSIMIAFLTVIVGVFLSATAGYALSRYRFPGYRPALNSFLVTQMFPAAIIIVPIFQMITNLHLVDKQSRPAARLLDRGGSLLYLDAKGYFDTIPISLEEAGRIDGLTPFGTFWRIVVPLSTPGLAVTCFYTFITAWNEVAFANIILISPEKYTLPVGMQTYVFQFDQAWEKLTAAAMLVTIPAVLVFLIAQRYLVSGLTRGGVQG